MTSAWVIRSNASMPSPAAPELELAVKAHFSGQLDEAERAYLSILERFPDDPRATHLLGLVYFNRGQLEPALPLLQKSLQLAPDVPEFHNNVALFCRSVGRPTDAVAHLQKAIQLDPNSLAAYENLGLVLEGLNDQAGAAAAYEKALQLDANHPNARARLGWTLWRLNRPADAVVQWQQAIQNLPTNGQAHDGLCVSFAQMGRVDEAILHGQQATQLDPQNPETWLNLGGALAAQSRYDEAIASLEQSIALNPQSTNALVNLAWLVERIGNPRRAIELTQHALQIDPNSARAWNQLSHSLHLVGDLDGAMQAAARATQIEPQHPMAWDNLGSAQLDAGAPVEAFASFSRAVEVMPAYAKARSDALMTMNYLPDHNPSQRFEAHKRFQTELVDQLGIPRLELPHDRDPERPLRIAYLSPDFRRHAVASFIEPILRSHDRSKFTISCYSDTRAVDDVTRRLRGYAGAWYDTYDSSDMDLAQRINDNREDIVIDLAGHTAGGRPLTLAFKPAPVQISYLGYLATTGLNTMDYRLTDSVADPAGTNDAMYTEKLLRLPIFFCYQPPDEAPQANELPASANGFVTFCSLNQPAKFNDRVIDLWSRLLKEIPKSKLILNANSGVASRQRLEQAFGSRGVGLDRLEFVQRAAYADYFALYHRADIALDPFPFNGHTTNCDAMWMGLPAITLSGDCYAGRTCTSLLTHLQLNDFVAADADRYISIARELADDLPRLAELRKSLRRRMSESEITDAGAFTANFENACRQAWRTWCNSK